MRNFTLFLFLPLYQLDRHSNTPPFIYRGLGNRIAAARGKLLAALAIGTHGRHAWPAYQAPSMRAGPRRFSWHCSPGVSELCTSCAPVGIAQLTDPAGRAEECRVLRGHLWHQARVPGQCTPSTRTHGWPTSCAPLIHSTTAHSMCTRHVAGSDAWCSDSYGEMRTVSHKSEFSVSLPGA